MTVEQRAAFRALHREDLKVGRAWVLKEMFRNLWLCESRKKGENYFGRWYSWAVRSRLAKSNSVGLATI